MRRDRERMQTTWDAVAADGAERLVGRDAEARTQLELLARGLGVPLGGTGTVLEIGCGTGRMTAELAGLWPRVVATDVSPAMLERARRRLDGRPDIRLVLTDGTHLDVAAGSVSTVVCFGVLQHVPRRRVLRALLRETARVLEPDGEALVQLPVLRAGLRPLVWRGGRRLAAGAVRRLRPRDLTATPAYRGARLTDRELQRLLRAAGLAVVGRAEAHDESLYSRYPHAADVRLRLRRLPP